MLVGRLDVREQQGDRDGPRPPPANGGDDPRDLRLRELDDDAAIRSDPLPHLESVPAANELDGPGREQVVHGGAHPVPDPQDVAEAGRRDEHDPIEGPVRSAFVATVVPWTSRSISAGGRRPAERPERGDQGARRIVRRGDHLREARRTVGPDRNRVGERPPDINPDSPSFSRAATLGTSGSYRCRRGGCGTTGWRKARSRSRRSGASSSRPSG